MMENNLINIGIIGDEYTGKTNILNIFNNQFFNEIEAPTTFCTKSFKKIVIINKDLKIIFSDITGLEKFRKISIIQLKNISGLILVYSINNKKSFENCEKWN